MRFPSFLCILLGVNIVGIGTGSVIGYYLSEKLNEYYWLYLSVPILTFGSFLMMYGALSNKDEK